MKFWLFFLFTAFLAAKEPEFELLPSTPDQVSALSTEDGSLIGGIVSPLSGQVCLRKIDLVAKGAQDIVLSRTYIAPIVAPPAPRENWESFQERCAFYSSLRSRHRGWTFLPHLYAIVRGDTIRITDRNGSTLDFQIFDSTLLTKPYGIGNAAHDIASGAYDLRNTRIWQDDDRISIRAPDGRTLVYVRENNERHLLTKEILPNGKILRYVYENGLPARIESLDPKERHIYAFVDIRGLSLEGSLRAEECRAMSHSGDSAIYKTYVYAAEESYKKKHRQGSYKIAFPPALSSASTPIFRGDTTGYTPHMQLCRYSGKSEDFVCSYKPCDKIFRIHTLSLPVGENGQKTPVYELHYDPPRAGEKRGSTTVLRSDGVKIVHSFSSEMLPEAILTYQPDGNLAKEKRWIWDPEHRLKAIQLKDGDGKILYAKEFEADEFGNPRIERFMGDLKGDGTLETCATLREFSNDGRHLLLREETEKGKVITFRYVPKTNLPIAKYTMAKEKILLREFWKYDDCNNLLEKIIDNGVEEVAESLAGVTQRTIIRFHLRQQPPFLHMPEWIEELYWEGGVEKSLRKTMLHYDSRGHVEQEEIFDSNGSLAYTIERQTDEQGNILSESDPLGFTTKTRYNRFGQPISSSNRSQKLETCMHYDANRRLSKLEEREIGGGLHTTHWEYDALGRCIQKIDFLGSATIYAIDPTSGEPNRIESPPILSLDEKPVTVASSAKYDPLGRKIANLDANGRCTKTRFNAYGSPTEIEYPDGSCEAFRYDKQGKLQSHTDEDGLTTSYKYDSLGHTVEKAYGSTAKETFVYDAFHLLLHTDKEGHTTKWEYDGAGRKISETLQGRTTRFFYDRLGFLASISKPNGLISQFDRDILGRILEERKTEASGKLFAHTSYRYDADGKQISITQHLQEADEREIISYDGFGRETERQDPLGFKTQIRYNETASNAIGQRILSTHTIDPNGIETLVYTDSYGQQVLQKIGASYTEARIYDPVGNLLQIDESGAAVRYSYDSRSRTTNTTRAFGTDFPRTTRYSYTPGGKLQTKTLPSGIVLTYGYDALGHPQSLTSSEGQIVQSFQYSTGGDLLFAQNGGHTLERKLDPFSNVIQETIDQKLTLKKTYDEDNRLASIVFPDKSSVRYTYDAAFLRSAARYSPEGFLLYTHVYTEYDLAGRLKREQLSGGLGEIAHSYNLRGQTERLQSPYFSEGLEYDPGGRVQSIADAKVTYDERSEITAEKGFNYSYDLRFNRIRKNGLETRYNPLDEIDEPHILHDLDGNLVRCGDRQFQYDPLRRLIVAEVDQKSVQFEYDAISRLQSKRLDGQEEFYLYHGTEELGSFRADGSIKELKLPGLGLHPIALELHGKIYVPIMDYRGNIRQLVNVANGETAELCLYSAFGEELLTGNSLSPWRYSAKRFDMDLGLYCFGKRWYDPILGRWLTVDPAGFVDGTNLYAYTRNNPLLYLDPEGKFAIPLISIAFGVGAAITPIGWVAIGIAAASCATVWGTQKLIESGRISPQAGAIATGMLGGVAGSMITSIPQPAWNWSTSGTYGGLAYVQGVGVLSGQPIFLKENNENQIGEVQGIIEEWMGEAETKENSSGDKIFLSNDGKRKVRFDFEDPHGDKPHMHLEEKISGKWVDASGKHRIYPKE